MATLTTAFRAQHETTALAVKPRTIVVIGSFAESLLNFRGDLLARMVEEGHRVIACAPGGSPSLVAGLHKLGVGYRSVPMTRSGLRLDQNLLTLRVLTGVLRDIAPDVVFAYTIKPVIYGLLAARRAGVSEAYAMITGLGHAFGGSGLRRRLVGAVVEQLYRQSLRQARRVFFQNPDDLAVFVERGLTRTEQAVLLNGSGVDVARFRPAPLPAQTSFLMIARLLVEKGIRDYVAAARVVRRAHPDVAFRVVGWCDTEAAASISEDELQGWIAEGVIEHLGRLTDVRPAIAQSSVYVLPTFYREGTPRTILEAMAMGRAIVTTDMPGCRETVVEGQNGHLVPPRNPDRLAEVLEGLIATPERIAAMGRASREIAVVKYDVHKVNALMLATMRLAAPAGQ